MTEPTLGVVVCAYTLDRLDQLRDCLGAIAEQLTPDDALVLVIDHQPALLARARSQWPSITVVANAYGRGLSGARTTGAALVGTEAVVFVDDDAVPQPGWAAAMRRRLADPRVTGVAGAVEPELDGARLPSWFPAEFGWVIGCDYRGLPADGQPVRNPIGANMAIRRAALLVVGGFDPDLGRVGTLPVGCEETELFIRVRAQNPAALVLRDTAARVRHHVPRSAPPSATSSAAAGTRAGPRRCWWLEREPMPGCRPSAASSPCWPVRSAASSSPCHRPGWPLQVER